MYRYVAVRKKVLGVDKLHMYIYTPIVAAQNQTYEFDQVKQMVLEALCKADGRGLSFSCA